MKSLRTVSSTDTFAALQLMVEVLDEKVAGFISSEENPTSSSEMVDQSLGLIVESSGSTGSPKKVELSVSAIRHSAEASTKRLGGDGQWLLALPTHFIAGANVLVRSVLSDTQPVIMNTRLPFTVDAFVRGVSLMEGERKYTSLVPHQLSKLAEAAEQDAFVFSMLRKFDAILVGGQQPNWSDVENLRSKGVSVVVSYGMTETCGGCVYDGVPLDGVSYKLEEGIILLAGPVLANGIGPWHTTSDLGVEFEGKLKVIGRADRVIISGGLKVSLDRVEEAALAIPGVEEVVALPVESQWGQSVGIIYVGSPEAEFSSLSESISVAASPRKVLRLSALPRLASGKPDLRECLRIISD
jgi:O-succinylbenzoic acid--CoA ligase